MSFRWAQFLRLAEELADQTIVFSTPSNPLSSPSLEDEAKLRASVSRAYYASFCSARNFLRDHDGDAHIPRDSPHFYVREQFAMSSDPARRTIARNLNRLRLARLAADYEDVFTLSVNKISFLLVDADVVLLELESLA